MTLDDLEHMPASICFTVYIVILFNIFSCAATFHFLINPLLSTHFPFCFLQMKEKEARDVVDRAEAASSLEYSYKGKFPHNK